LCSANYTLVNGVCTATCELENNCPVEVKIKIPLPGSISAVVWIIVLVVFKIFIVKKLYLPYSFMFLGCFIEYILIIVILGNLYSTVSIGTSRLLQSVSTSKHSQIIPSSYLMTAIGLLATTLVLNYISNFVYIFLFCRYLRKFIPDRQIDKISNDFVLGIGVITNYRFSLVAYSKLFPKPNILVENQSKLTPIHYLCIVSMIVIILPLAASGVLIYN
jgi:hypothetical protein